jgi:hypothetical protein
MEEGLMAHGTDGEDPGLVQHESDPTAVAPEPESSEVRASGGSVSVALLVDVVVVLGALFIGAAGLVSIFAPQVLLTAVGVSGESINAGTDTFARYTGTRDVALGAALLALVAVRSRRVLAGLVVVTALANALDGAVDLVAERWPEAPGPFVFAIFYLAAAVWLVRQDRREGAAD